MKKPQWTVRDSYDLAKEKTSKRGLKPTPL